MTNSEGLVEWELRRAETQKIKSEVYRVQKGGLIYMKGDCALSQEYCVLLQDAAHIYCGQESTILAVSH